MWDKTRYIPHTFIILNSKESCVEGCATDIFVMKKIFLLLVLLITALASHAELWTPVGQVQWTDGILGCQDSRWNTSWTVSVERSNSRSGVFRLQPYANFRPSTSPEYKYNNVYVYLHVEDTEKVYIEYYSFYYRSNSYTGSYHVYQRCVENGFDSQYYGKVSNNTTVEFPIGAFAVDDLSSSAPRTSPTSDAKYSSRVHKIVFPEGVLDYKPVVDTWVNIGKGLWEDPWFTMDDAKYKGDINVEKSVQRPDVYRFKPYESIGFDYYAYVHTENQNKVYLEPYKATGSSGQDYVFTQLCEENEKSQNLYGKIENGKITIPSQYFEVTYGTNTGILPSGQNCVITLPSGYNDPIEEDSGVFMGIVSFNDKITNKPIASLDENNKDKFMSFVDDLQMGNATLLYYAVDQAIDALKVPSYPNNLSNAVLVTFTDGLDQGSLAMKPEYRTSKGYAAYLAEKISGTKIQENQLQAYSIGLKSGDVADDELFMLNLESLASSFENALSVNNIAEVQQELANIYDNLNRQTTKRVVSIAVPMMSHGDTYRFTLDRTTDNVADSKMWIEGVFSIDDISLTNLTYHGMTSASGSKVVAERDGVYLKFTFNDCRDSEGNVLTIEKDDIDQWTYIASRDVWQHNVENDKDGKINIEDIKSSAAIMFALDCSSSLGDLFPVLKETAKSFIDRLAGGNGDFGAIEGVEDDEFTADDPNAEPVYYNLQGMRINNPGPGLYICQKGSKVTKVLIK